MLKSDIVTQLRVLEASEYQLYIHFEALGMDASAYQHAQESFKWEWVADLVEEHVQSEGDSDINTGLEVINDEYTVIEGAPNEDV